MDRKTYTGTITHLEPNQIFVFGSNTEGRHGRGSALTAMRFAAKYGQARGLQGQTYAIETKDLRSRLQPSIRPIDIISQIQDLYVIAYKVPKLEFLIAYSRTGTNLNGYTPSQMATMFIKADTHIPANIIFEKSFWELIQSQL